MKEGRENRALKVWCCVVKAGSLDTLQLFFTLSGEEPIGKGRKCRMELWSCWDLTSTQPHWQRNAVRVSIVPHFTHSVILYKSLSPSPRLYFQCKFVTVFIFTPTPLLSAQAFQKHCSSQC